MRKVIHERSPAMARVPGGGSTGLLGGECKGKGATAEVYKVEQALLAKLRAHELQAAEEMERIKANRSAGLDPAGQLPDDSSTAGPRVMPPAR